MWCLHSASQWLVLLLQLFALGVHMPNDVILWEKKHWLISERLAYAKALGWNYILKLYKIVI